MEINDNKLEGDLILQNIEGCRKLNKKFSLFDYIKGEIEFNNVCTDIYCFF